MRPTALFCLVIAALLVSGVGCEDTTANNARESVATAQAAPATPDGRADAAPAGTTEPEPVADDGKPINLKGYINVSSGCQDATVTLLEKYADEHERVELELIDFGKPEGSRKWRADGYSCMAILINGHKTVTFGPKDDRRILTMTYPPGFMWTLKDLETALQGALDGSIYYGKEPGAKPVETPSATLRITSREAKLGGKTVGEVLINGKVALRMRTSYDDLPPLQRAERAAARLKRGVARGFTPTMLRVVERGDEVLLVAADKVICTADKPQADGAGTTPKGLAQAWVASLKKALTAALSS